MEIDTREGEEGREGGGGGLIADLGRPEYDGLRSVCLCGV